MKAPPPTREISDFSRLPAEPLVSIYMLAYNHERFVSKAIEGVISQQRDFPIELIIGEDHSTDSTGAIVRSYQERHPDLIRILTANKNVGAHANATRCIEAARGRFLASCEGDDYWHNSNKLQLQVSLMTSLPNVALCHTDYDRRIGFRVKPHRHRLLARERVAQEDAYVSLLLEWTVVTATAMYRTEIAKEFLRTPFFESRWPFGDYNLALYASIKGKVAYIPVSTATWRRVAGSASNSGPEKALAMHMAATECRYRFMQAYPVSYEERLSIECNIHLKYLRLAFRAARPDIYGNSLNWLKEQGHISRSTSHAIKLWALRARYPAMLANTFRRALRWVAEFSI